MRKEWIPAGLCTCALLALAGCGGGGDDEVDPALDSKGEVVSQLISVATGVFLAQALTDAVRYEAPPPGAPPPATHWAKTSRAAAAKAALGACADGGSVSEQRSTTSYQGPFQSSAETFSVLARNYADCRDVSQAGDTEETVLNGTTEGADGPTAGGSHPAYVNYGVGTTPFRTVTRLTPAGASAPTSTDTVDLRLHEDARVSALGELSSYWVSLDANLVEGGATHRFTVTVGTAQQPARMVFVIGNPVDSYSLDLQQTVSHDRGPDCPSGTVAALTDAQNPLRYDRAQGLFIGGLVTLTQDNRSARVQFLSNGDAQIQYAGGATETLTVAEQDAAAAAIAVACGG